MFDELMNKLEKLQKDGYPYKYMFNFAIGFAQGWTISSIAAYMSCRNFGMPIEEACEMAEIEKVNIEKIEAHLENTKQAKAAAIYRNCRKHGISAEESMEITGIDITTAKEMEENIALDKGRKTTWEYKGYRASIEYDDEDDIYIGAVLGIRDSLIFHGNSQEEAVKMFQKSIDNYLDVCRKLGKEPDKPKTSE